MNCPNCGTPNVATSRFCIKCGVALAGASLAGQTLVSSTRPAQPASQPGAPAQEPLVPQPRPAYPTPSQGTYGASGGSLLNIWGPFAGYGMRRRHTGWLLNGQGTHSPELVSHVESKFRDREIPGTQLSKVALVARGVGVESRPYFVLRRGLASLALHITQFGRDLFISQASYLKPPISNFRVLVVLAMLVFQLLMAFIYPPVTNAAFSSMLNDLGQSLNPFGGGGGGSGLAGTTLLFLVCVFGPLGGLNTLLLLVLFCFSAYKWLTEKDFFAALRVPPNEFDEDDLMAMEKAVEETVRQALTDLELNPDELRVTNSELGRQLF